MGRVVTLLSAVTFVIISFTCRADTKEKYWIAVLGVEAKGPGFTETIIDHLERQLAFKLKKSGWKNLVYPWELKRNCKTRSCQIEKARLAGAGAYLITRIQKSGGRCSLGAGVYNLKTGEQITSLFLIGACSEKILSSSVASMADQLARTKPYKTVTGQMKSEALKLVKEKRYPEAIKIFRRVLEIDSNDCASLVSLGIVYAKMGEKAVSHTYYKRFLDTCPANFKSPGDFPIPVHMIHPGDYPVPAELKRPGDYFIDYQHIRG